MKQNSLRRFFVVLFLASGTLLWSQARAISHIGTSFIFDNELGFEAQLPLAFRAYSVTIGNRNSRSDAIIAVPQEQSSGTFSAAEVLIANAAIQFKDQHLWSRTATHEYMLESKYTPIATTNDCMDAYFFKGDLVQKMPPVMVVFWGMGKGVVLSSARVEFGSADLEQIKSRLELREGACQW